MGGTSHLIDVSFQGQRMSLLEMAVGLSRDFALDSLLGFEVISSSREGLDQARH